MPIKRVTSERRSNPNPEAPPASPPRLACHPIKGLPPLPDPSSLIPPPSPSPFSRQELKEALQTWLSTESDAVDTWREWIREREKAILRLQCLQRTRLANRRVADTRYHKARLLSSRKFLSFLEETIDRGGTAVAKVAGLRQAGAPDELLVEGERMAQGKWREAEAASVCRAVIGIGDENKDGDSLIITIYGRR